MRIIGRAGMKKNRKGGDKRRRGNRIIAGKYPEIGKQKAKKPKNKKKTWSEIFFFRCC
jgi:hypothetical protein